MLFEVLLLVLGKVQVKFWVKIVSNRYSLSPPPKKKEKPICREYPKRFQRDAVTIIARALFRKFAKKHGYFRNVGRSY